MAIRKYLCTACEHLFETYQLTSSPLLKQCPECGTESLKRDLTGEVFNADVRKGAHEASTVGHLAEINTKNMSEWERESKEQSLKDREESIKKERVEKLEKAGFSPIQKKKTDIGTPSPKDLPKHIKQAIAKEDKKAIKKYIKEGK